ncbi:MAG: hypothetical protein AAFV09_11550, partial [Pseudomonadota bacterium]
DFAGDVELMLSISDGTATITDDFTLTVTGVNDAPELLTPLADVSTDRKMRLPCSSLSSLASASFST